MKVFKYGFFAKVIYRYGILPINLILIFYLLVSIIAISNDWKFIFPILINIILIYTINRYYFRMFKLFPFRIEINNEKMVCSDFVINNRKIELEHSEIKSITGGIFSGRSFAPLYIQSDGEKIGISPHIKDFNKLLTIILTNIPKELYESLLETIKKVAFNNAPKSGKKKKKD